MISSKRKKPTTFTENKKKVKQDDVQSTSNNNKYSADDVAEESEEVREGIPPPIFIPCVSNISQMVKKITSVIPSEEFNYKSFRDGQVKLLIKSIDSYRKIVKYLDVNKISFHTYQIKSERAYRVVLKGLHFSTPLSDIKAELLALGHQVRCIVNVKSQVTKQPLPMFFVDLDPGPDNKKIYDIRHINHAVA